MSILYRPLRKALGNWRQHQPLPRISSNQGEEIPIDMATLGHHINGNKSCNCDDYSISSHNLETEELAQETSCDGYGSEKVQ